MVDGAAYAEAVEGDDVAGDEGVVRVVDEVLGVAVEVLGGWLLVWFVVCGLGGSAYLVDSFVPFFPRDSDRDRLVHSTCSNHHTDNFLVSRRLLPLLLLGQR